jgi:hypothetical protein
VFRIESRRRIALVGVALLASACGAAATPVVQSTVPKAPTYKQVLLALAKVQSVHMVADLAPGATGDVRGDFAGDISGTMTFSGGSFEIYTKVVESAGKFVATHYDFIPNTSFSVSCKCHLTPNVCAAFPASMQAETGLSADALIELFTPEGLTHEVVASAATMTVQGNTVVDQLPVYILKGSGTELDVPYGSMLPVRYVRANGTSVTLTDWNSVGAIAKPASCP